MTAHDHTQYISYMTPFVANNPIRFGIVGCGAIATAHAQAMASTQETELVAAYSRDKNKLHAFTVNYDKGAAPLAAYTDYESFLAHDGLDAVVLCTPNGTHAEFGIQAVRSGKHLVVEKPLEITVERAKPLLTEAENAGVQVAVIYQNRFIPVVMQLKQIVDTNQLGRLVMVRASVKWYRDQEYYSSRPWRGSLALDGGGALINQAIHTTDLLLWMAGEVDSVQAFRDTLAHEGIEGEDALVASFRMSSGALGVMEASTSIQPAQNRLIELHGTLGTAVLDGDALQVQLTDSNGKNQASTPVQEPDIVGESKPSAGNDDPFAGFSAGPHAAQYRQIARAWLTGHTAPVSGEESLRSLAFTQAAYQSADSGRPVSPSALLG